MVCSGIPPSPAHQGVTWALSVLTEFAENPQLWEQEFYSTAFLCRACSRKIPWDAFYIAVSWLSEGLAIIFFNFFSLLEEGGTAKEMV